MKVILHTSSILPMLHFLQDLKNKQASRQHLEKLFNHPDYDYEFKRYEISSKEPVIDYFMQLGTISEENIPELESKRRQYMLKHKHKAWLAAYENPEYYEALYHKMNAYLTEDMLDSICLSVQKGLPDGIKLSDVRAISTMSIGTSFGYVFDGAFHFDLMGIENGNVDMLPGLIAHEVHHLAFSEYTSAFFNSLTLEEKYIFYFSGEGLAIKFCNNAQGVFSKALDASKPLNDGLDAYSMDYLNQRFDESYRVFEETLEKIRAGAISEEEIFQQFNDFWLKFHVEGQNPDDPPALKQPRMYSFGNDLYGTIYDAYGLETMFDCVRHPLKAVECFKAITQK